MLQKSVNQDSPTTSRDLRYPVRILPRQRLLQKLDGPPPGHPTLFLLEDTCCLNPLSQPVPVSCFRRPTDQP
ncbi:hypothetical protein D4764_22G0001560 [Takifugu flavidus]|uniref:Uncharacterized protein n=1 Tax=Takifugu flavidus TaxID=433684 RepID=A0A5C6NCU0_9TELE|nr:hypothetical protein D4764_22G0001560 [Takifugu flavidus]